MSARVLIACEFSGVVRRAFARLGYDAWSCDLLPAEDRSNRHIVGDARELLRDGWGLLIVAHPPCTRLCNSGVRWLTEPPGRLAPDQHPLEVVAAYASWGREERLAFMWRELDRAADLFAAFWNAPIPHVAVENPVMHRHAKSRIAGYQPPAQTVQPWRFGEPAFKATSFYLRNLPPLAPTRVLTPPPAGTAEHRKWSRVHRAPPGPNRWKLRSRTYPGIAAAMAEQWGAAAFGRAAA